MCHKSAKFQNILEPQSWLWGRLEVSKIFIHIHTDTHTRSIIYVDNLTTIYCHQTNENHLIYGTKSKANSTKGRKHSGV